MQDLRKAHVLARAGGKRGPEGHALPPALVVRESIAIAMQCSAVGEGEQMRVIAWGVAHAETGLHHAQSALSSSQ